MADPIRAIDNVLKAEGGYQDNPNDNGNYACGQLVGTNYGISAPALQDYLGRCPNVFDSIDLSREDAWNIYKYNYWDKVGGDFIEDQQVAEIIFDAYVNQTGYVRSMTQQALANQGKNISVSIPFSQDVIKAINKCNSGQFFNDFKALREQKYITQSQKSGQDIFLQGWLNRLSKFEYNFFARNKKLFFYILVALIITVAGFYTYIEFKGE